MPQPRSIAAAQTVPRRGDVDANLAEHLRLVPVAAERGAQILVFPELSLTGYELDLAESLAFSPNDARLELLTRAAATSGMILVVGAPVRAEGHLYLGALILHPNGTQDLYTKHHLGAFSPRAAVDGTVPPAENTVFQAGHHNPLLPLGHHTAAVAICADVGQPSHSQRAAEQGADTYLASMFVIPSEFEGETVTLQSTASRCRMAVVLANYGGPSGGLASAGQSTIWSPRGEVLARLGSAGAGVVVATEGKEGWVGEAVPVE